ncbi:hypothetical protein C8R44DRAFT_869627 [Mycena epipterygia]|nr:hypothetical protein C8R44DRAFT_869627 [Mycena epipterygia]
MNPSRHMFLISFLHKLQVVQTGSFTNATTKSPRPLQFLRTALLTKSQPLTRSHHSRNVYFRITKVIEIILVVPAISIFQGELRLFFPLSLTVLILHRLFSIRITFWVNINNYYLSFDTHSGPQRPRNISIASQFPVPVLDIVLFAVNVSVVV